MANRLVVVALTGFAVAIGAAVIVTSLGGPKLRNRQGAFYGLPVFTNFSFPGSISFGGSCGGDNTSDATATKTLAWTDSSDKITIDLAANVNWAPGSGTNVTLSGPAADVNRIRIDGDEITADCEPDDFRRLTITLPGRMFKDYEMNGVGQLHLTGLNQPSISLDVSGAALVDAAGVVPQTNLTVSGAASINLEHLITQDLKADLSGASNLTANPAETADIDLSGAGLVTLLTRPKNYHADIEGLGHIDVPDQPTQPD